MNYHKEIEETKDLLKKGSYTLCIMLCGKILESAIKYLFYRYLETVNKKERISAMEIQQRMVKSHERSYSDFPLGKMVTLLERANAVSKIIPNDYPKQDRRAKINLWDLVDIRNRATHSNQTDKDGIGEEHAHIMYGNVLRITNSPEIKQYMKSYKEKETCSNCHELYSADDGFVCKSCGESFCPNCLSNEESLCAKCKSKASISQKTKLKIPTPQKVDRYVPVHTKIKKGISLPQEEKPRVPSVYFESHLRVRFSHIYTVIHFMNLRYEFSDAVNETLRLFPNVKDYQTIEDKCGRGFAGDIPTFKKWYDSGVILKKLRSKFFLSDHDYKIFEDLLSKREKTFLPKVVSKRKIPSRTVLRKKKTDMTTVSSRTSQQYVTAGQFRHLGNGIFQYDEDLNVKIDANLPSAEVKRELGTHGLRVKNLGSFYYQLRVKADLIGR